MSKSSKVLSDTYDLGLLVTCLVFLSFIWDCGLSFISLHLYYICLQVTGLGKDDQYCTLSLHMAAACSQWTAGCTSL